MVRVLFGLGEAGLSGNTVKMNTITKRKERLRVKFAVLVITICFLIIMSTLINISKIKATCKPFSGMSRNRTEVPELEVVEEPQPQIIEESITVAAKEASSEPVQNKNDELAKSRETTIVEVQAAKLRIDELTKSRDAAIAEAQAAKLKIDELAKKLEAETEKVRVIQKKLKQVQVTVAELKSTIKL
jgi:chromosome segregation ATPase